MFGKSSIFRRRPELVFWGLVGFLLLSYLLIYAVDIRNIFGLRDLLVRVLRIPYFWFYWFQAPVENPLQWLLLGGAVITFASIAGAAYQSGDRRTGAFGLLMGFGLLLLLLEDAGDVRHVYRTIVEAFAGAGQYAIEGTYGIAGTLFELAYFAVLAAIMIFALWRYRDVYWSSRTPRAYFAVGVVLYGLAVSSSWLGNAFRAVTPFRDLYSIAGERVIAGLFRGRPDTTAILKRTSQAVANDGMHPLEFAIMDRVYEESLELLAAGAFFVAGLALLFAYQARRGRE